MSDDKPKSHNISNTAAFGVGGLAGALGTSSFLTNKLAPVNNVFYELERLVHAGESSDAIKAFLNTHQHVDAEEANHIIEAIEQTTKQQAPSQEAVTARNNLGANLADKKLTGFSKTLYKHPRAIIATGALAGGAVALGTLSTIRGNEKPAAQTSFTEREDARRVEAAMIPPEAGR